MVLKKKGQLRQNLFWDACDYGYITKLEKKD
jgi:hypothetical protein